MKHMVVRCVIWLVLMFTVALAVAMVIITMDDINNGAMESAIAAKKAVYVMADKCYEEGNYVDALRIFLELEDWADSGDRVKECVDRLEIIQNAYYAWEPYQKDPTH